MHPLVRDVQKKQLKQVPEIRTGYTVRVHQKIKEGGKERIQQFEGLVIKVSHGEGTERTFTIRKIVEGIGVEKVFPVHSSNITKIVIKKKAKIRRSKLYYMRERSGKSARLTERHVTDEERAAEKAKMDEYINEAVKEEEKRKKEEGIVEAEQEPETASEAVKTETVEAPAESDAEASQDAPQEEASTEEEEKKEVDVPKKEEASVEPEASESDEENKEEKPPKTEEA